MEAMKTYLISVTSVAIICGGVLALVGNKGSTATILRLLTGIFMTYTILNPLVDINLNNLEYISEEFVSEANNAVSTGKYMAASEKNKFIIDKYKAYILDKASSLNADLKIDIRLDDQTGLVSNIVLEGAISPFAKKELTNYLTDDLGIPGEVQNWME